jgi:hypothetical protein
MTVGPELTKQEADAELGRLDLERTNISAALVELDAHPGHQLLETAARSGETLRRWTSARATLAGIHQQFETYRLALDDAHDLRSRRAFGELTELLRGESIELSNEALPLQRRSLTGPSTVIERVSFAALVDRMNSEFTQVAAVVAEADTIWSTIVQRLDTAQERLTQAQALADSLSLAETEPSLAAELDRVRAEVARLRERVVSDPLSVSIDDGAQLPAQADAIAQRLTAIESVRDGFVGRVTAIRAELDRLRAAEAEVSSLRTTVTVKIAESALPPVVSHTAGLLARLDRLGKLGDGGNWRRLAEELPAFEGEVAQTLRRVRAERDAIGGLLGRRDELRGRLDAYRAKAAGIGHSEDRELARLFDAAQDLLWTAPCDLSAATRALARYQQAVTAREAQLHG